VTLQSIVVTSSGSAPVVNAVYQVTIPSNSGPVALSVGASSSSVCTIDASGLVTISGVAGTCVVLAAPLGTDGVPGAPSVVQTIDVAPLEVSASLKSVAGKLKPIENQIVKVAQPITLKLPTNSKIVKVTVNGKAVKVTINKSGQLQLPFLIGPKDKVVVSVEVNGQTVLVPVAPENGRIALANVNFNFASSNLTSNAKSILERVANVVRQHGFTKVNLIGFTDVLTSAGFSNQKLSDQRAAAVRAYFKALMGSTKVTIVIENKAAKDPIIKSLAPKARAIIRRVEIIVH